jgi:hypothetical protein
MDLGWIKLYRQMLDNHFLMNDDKAWNVFSKLLIMVNRKGEIAAGRRQLAEIIRINDRTLYDVLVRLEKEGMLTIKSNPKYSVIHIVNFANYQGRENKNDERSENILTTAYPTAQQQMIFEEPQQISQPQPNHSPTTAQHSNKNKNKKSNHIDDPLFEVMEEFRKMRAKIKKPLTDYAEKLVRKDLMKWYPTEPHKQIVCVENSIRGSWQGIFPLKDDAQHDTGPPKLSGYVDA